VEHPQFQARSAAGAIVEMPVGDLGPVKLVMSPLHLSETPISARMAPPDLGEHTDSILADLGFSETEIGRFHDEAVVQ
jgi:crotonobetainyl-CoA:carnitine CoA-transferase CaiB-like acyl-CoA transferase